MSETFKSILLVRLRTKPLTYFFYINWTARGGGGLWEVEMMLYNFIGTIATSVA